MSDVKLKKKKKSLFLARTLPLRNFKSNSCTNARTETVPMEYLNFEQNVIETPLFLMTPHFTL